MRILVHGLVGKNLGGIETFLLNMNDFMPKDCIFDYVIEEDQCIHTKRIKNKGGRIYRVRSRAEYPIGNVIDIIKLYKRCRNEYKTIYYNLSSLSWILPEIIGRLMRYRIVVHSHNAMLIDANSGILHRNMNYLNKWILSHMKVVRLACSQFASDFMFQKRESTIIYNGIDVDKYRFSKEIRKKIRNQYSISNDTFVVGTVGRLAYQKNPLFTVQIFYEIQKRTQDSILLMFGDGNLKNKIEEKVRALGISDKVIMPGIVDNINEVLNAMDIFLLPSRHEGLGIVLIEAQANGLPCFTSKDVVPAEAGVTDIIEWLSLENSSVYWAQKIIEVNNHQIQERKSYNNLIKKSKFNIQFSADKLQALLFENK